MIAMMIEDYLEHLGCTVVATAARLEDALESAQTLAVDVAVLDVNLAGQLSYPVAIVLRRRNIPFLFATGYGAVGLPSELSDAPLAMRSLTDPTSWMLVGAKARPAPRRSGPPLL